MDKSTEILAGMKWIYADGDPAACAELSRRIAAIGRTEKDMLTYSRLVDGVTFRLPNVGGGEPFEFNEWSNLERAIIGDFLGKVAADSYQQGRFLASALVIGVNSNGPGEGFYALAKEAGLLRSSSETARLQFWLEHVKLAREWYGSHPQNSSRPIFPNGGNCCECMEPGWICDRPAI